MSVLKIKKNYFHANKLRASHRDQYKRFTRSKIGNFFYTLFLIVFGLYSILPMIYSVVTSFKPLDELLVYPPKFFVQRPTLTNYMILPSLLDNLQVPLTRYIFNSLFNIRLDIILYRCFKCSKLNIYIIIS